MNSKGNRCAFSAGTLLSIAIATPRAKAQVPVSVPSEAQAPSFVVSVPFWGYWTSPEKVAIKKTIYRSWLGDVKNGDMTNKPHARTSVTVHATAVAVAVKPSEVQCACGTWT